MRTDIARLKMPVGANLLTDILKDAIRNPPCGYTGADIRVGFTDADGWTPIFAERHGKAKDAGKECF